MLKQKHLWKKWIGCMLIVLTIFSICPIETKADVIWPQGPEISTPSAIVMELNSGAILYEKNSHEENYPASITKIMTTMLALEHCNLDEVVTFSADAVFKNEGNTSHIARDFNEQMTMEECLYAVMLESANECAYAVAEHVGAKLGGNYQTFVDLMNQKAEELGCTNTHFNNANGLPDENHWTSAADMALIAREAYKNETFRIIISTKRYVIPPTNKHSEKTYLNNHHEMIHNYKTNQYLYKYATGGKTGYTQAAGATLVSYAEKDGMDLVCVVMHTSTGVHYDETEALFEYCFENFMTHNITDSNMISETEEKGKGFMNYFDSYVTLDDSATIILPVTAAIEDAKCSFVEDELVYTYGDKIIGSAKILTSGANLKNHYLYDKFNQVEKEERIIKIKPVYIVLVILIIIALTIITILLRMLYKDFYLIRHNMKVKRQKRRRHR